MVPNLVGAARILRFGMIPFENDHNVGSSRLAAAWGLRVGWTLLGFLVGWLAGFGWLAVCSLAGWAWLGLDTGHPPHIREQPNLLNFVTAVLREHFLARLWRILPHHFCICAES